MADSFIVYTLQSETGDL